MLIVMQNQASEDQIAGVVKAISAMGLDAHPMPGHTRTAIGVTGNAEAIDAARLEGLPGVLELVRVTKPYKLVSREMHPDDTLIELPPTRIGAGTFTIIAGPCSVESEENIMQVAHELTQRGVHLLRAGAFKPRTSPYSFQGMEQAGLDILAKAREKTGIRIVTEVMDAEHVSAVEQAADVLQVGTRNMQNYSLLKRLSRSRHPVLLKRGMSATLEEWLMAAEYIMSGGNRQVILCERGVRTFADHTRNTLDLSVVPPVKQFSHLPIIVDPSHGTGRRDYVPAMSLAALAAGADGLMLEVHPDPKNALSDGAQTIDFEQFDRLLESLRQLTGPLGRELN